MHNAQRNFDSDRIGRSRVAGRAGADKPDWRRLNGKTSVTGPPAPWQVACRSRVSETERPATYILEADMRDVHD